MLYFHSLRGFVEMGAAAFYVWWAYGLMCVLFAIFFVMAKIKLNTLLRRRACLNTKITIEHYNAPKT